MKSFCWISFSVVFLILGCQNPAYHEGKNKFLFSKDILIIRTNKAKESGLFSLGANGIVFKDTAEKFQYPVTFSKNISDIKRMQMPTDPYAKETDFIDIICGLKDNKRIFIVDQNDNEA